MQSFSCWIFVLLSVTSILASPTRTFPRVDPPPSSFVTASGSALYYNGSPFRFVGTNAYWIPFLNSDDDISKTFADMKAIGITVVRTWAFNDVTEIPDQGSYFQLIANGTTTINTGPDGLQRLDKVIELAEKNDIKIIFSLTNNWNPIAKQSSASGSPPLPRNYLSNDYGGMDAYVREFTETQTHDEFYTDQTIRKFFEEYLQAIVSRFVTSTTLLGWELANDARCASSLASSPSCTTQTITQWHSDISKFILSIDDNHLITSGNHGFFCPDCPKLFFNMNAPPSPRAPSPAPGGVGSSFDGSHGVDSQDILSIPEIGFGTFQLFSDQNSYSTIASEFTSPNADFNGTVEQGVAWIKAQAASAQAVGKPVVCSAFGLVSEGNIGVFIPFNDTTPVVTSSSTDQKRQSSGTVGTGVTNSQVVSAYQTWFQAGFNNNVSGMNQYQDFEQNLTPAPGTVVQSSNSPNDGYGSLGTGQSDLQQTILSASQLFT